MAKTASKSKTAYLSAYKANNRWATNRRKKLERQLKLQPNNMQVKAALDALGGQKYRRKTPTTPVWSSGNIRIAKLFKEFVGHVHKDLFSSNPKLREAALREHSRRQLPQPQGKVDFSIAARLQGWSSTT